MPRPRACLGLLALVLFSSLSLAFAGCCCGTDDTKKCIKDPPCKPCEQPSCEGYAPKPK